jgi:hypothetical protein
VTTNDYGRHRLSGRRCERRCPFLFSKIMDYLIMECRYNYNPDDADTLFATNDRQAAIEAAKEFGLFHTF